MSEQAMEALYVANERRLLIADLRGQVRSGQLAVEDILAAPPEVLMNLSLYEVMMLGRGGPRAKGSARVRHKIGQRAAHDQVNVLIALGDASERTRRWAAANLPRRHGPQKDRATI